MDRRHKKLRTLIFEDRKVKVQFYKLLCKSKFVCYLLCYTSLHCAVHRKKMFWKNYKMFAEL